jgi:hypothetical protein
MTKKLEDYFKEFEDKVAGVEGIIGREIRDDSRKRMIINNIINNFILVKRFIKAHNLENQRDLWLTTVDLLNDSKVFNDEVKEKMRETLLVYCFKELENLNNTIHLQLANKPDTTVEGNAEKFEESEKKGTGKVKPFNWQGTQAQLVYLIEQLYKQGFLSPISQAEKHRLTAQHFTVKGKSLNPRTLAQARENNLSNRDGKPKDAEKIEQIVSAAKKQNP